MFKKLFPSLNIGIERLRQHSQLWYTIFVATIIFVAFVFVANQFVTIAQDAQDRLVNIRLGSMQDSLVEFIPDYLYTDADILQDRIRRIAFQNPTIKEFKIVEFSNDEPIILASLLSTDVGKVDEENSFNYSIAENNPNFSFTTEELQDNERLYTTTRIITDQYQNEIGAVLTQQSLSEADLKISESIQNSVLIFILIVILIMFLFFRHARIIDYASLYRKLESVDRLKDDFISMASHELRTPLTIIRGYAEELQETKRVPKLAKENVEKINVVVDQLNDLVNDMLDVSRIEQDRMRVELQKINPSKAIETVVKNLLPVANEKDLSLVFNNSLKKNDLINIDSNKFRQIMINLVNNAIKYTEEGRIEVKAIVRKKKVLIRVSDTGIGIGADEQKKLFQKFSRVSSDKTTEIRGTGLGLWITRQLVELMGGKISLESIKGIGTHVILSFPIF